MKLLFVSNFYPPHHLGGYELLCQEIANLMIERGHQVEVLTSTYQSKPGPVEAGIHRRLRLQSDIHYYRPQRALRYFCDRRANVAAVRETLTRTRPDVVLIWGMWNLPWSVAAEVEAVMGSRVAYYLNNAWPIDPSPHQAYWEGTGQGTLGQWFLRTLRGPVSWLLRDEWLPCGLRFEHVAVCSSATKEQIRQAGLDTSHYRVVYHGIDVETYRSAAAERQRASDDTKLRVVFVGSLLPQKGVHTAIEAMGHLAQSCPNLHVSLDILGAGHPDYENRLHGMTADLGLSGCVTFHSPIPRQQLPAFLARFDALALPSIWEEPMALISQEAMAAGLVLIGTLTGGTKEILEDRVNGLAFRPEDSITLAAQIEVLAEDGALRHQLSTAAQATAVEMFAMDRTLSELELLLSDACCSNIGIESAKVPKQSRF